MTTNGKVLITGGAGLIGSHIAGQIASGDSGIPCGEIIVLDDFSRGTRDNLAEVAGGWRDRIGRRSVVLAGDGAVRYAGEAEAALGQTVRILPMPAALAVGVGQLAVRATPTQRSPPHGIAPLYIRRPDAELARDQRTRGTSHR